MIPEGIVIHHSSGSEKTAQQLRDIFRKRFGVSYIGYHVAISQSGQLWSDIAYTDVGIHNNKGRLNNTNSIGICLIGNFNNNSPSEEQLKQLKILLLDIKKKFLISNKDIVAHRDMKATACPGQIIYNWLEEYKKGEEDMYTDKSGVFDSKPRSAEEWYNSAILYRNKLIKADSENKARIGALEDAQEALKKELKDIRQDRDNITDTLVEYGEQIDYWNSLTPVELILKGLKSLFKRK